MRGNMKKLLITGFEPFGGEKINPSWSAVELLPSEICGYALTKLCVPVTFDGAAGCVIDAAKQADADVVLCIGQAGGRRAITPELVGINLRYATVPDNNGAQPKDEPVICGACDACFSTLPVRKMANAINASGIPSSVSYSAGTYVCNDLLYSLLAYFKESKTRVGFIHVPYCSDQSKEPSMDIDMIVKALVIAIGNLDD